MKQLFKDLDKYMIRTPMFSLKKYKMFFDENNNKENLKLICNDKIFREAILISSRSLYNTILDFNNGKNIKKYDYFIQSIYKYLIRMTTRPTPFGLFSAIDWGKYDEKSSFYIKDENIRKIARPDIEWIINLVKNLENKYYNQLKFKINSSIFIKGSRASLIYSTEKEKDLKIGEISVRATRPFKRTIELAENEISYTDLKNTLIKEFSIDDAEKIDNFLGQLIKKEFLISNLRPPLTVINQFDYIITKIKENLGSGELLDNLLNIKNKIEIYNKQKIGEGESLYLEIYDNMINLANTKNILQIDSKLNIEKNYLNKDIIKSLNELFFTLFKLSSANKGSFKFLSNYKQEFIEKYGVDREIPLLELLDNDLGIGPPINYERPKSNRISVLNTNNDINESLTQYFIEKYYTAIKNDSTEIVLTDTELKNLNLPPLNYEEIPNSLEINLILKKEKSGNMLYYLGPNLGSISAGKSFGRFSHILEESKSFFDLINNEKKDLKGNDYVTCEISYLPNETRNANVARNMHGSDYEISIFTNGSKNDTKMLKLDDIFIGIENNKFYARSKSLNKKIIVTLNNMLNSNLAPNPIRFLCEVSLEDKLLWYDFIWNDIYKDFSYIPSIRYKNFIISPATWILNRFNLKSKKEDNYENFKKEFNIFQHKYKLPQYIYISFSDNRVLLNLNNEECLKVLYHTYKNNTNLILNSYEANGEYISNSCYGEYVNEVIIPLIKEKQNIPQPQKEKKVTEYLNSFSKKRLKYPFDEWLYFNLYGVSSNIDDLIAYYIPEYCNKLVQDKKIEKYFFMRYIDSEPHIRLRLNASQNKLLEIYPEISNWLEDLIEKKIMTTYSINSYEREVERYGGTELIDVAEEIFYLDTLIVESIIRNKRENIINFSDEILGIISIIHYMNDFGIPYSEQVNYLRNQVTQSDYRNEFKLHRKDYIEICNDNNEWENIIKRPGGKELIDILNIRSEHVKYYSNLIKMKNKKVDLSILDSLIHLHCNRLFGIDREFEKKVRALTSHSLYAIKHFK